MKSRSQIEKLSAQIEALASLLGQTEPIPEVSMYAGEELPQSEADTLIVTSVFGALPRMEHVTQKSLLNVLPEIKRFLAQQDADDAEWRALAEQHGIDFDKGEERT